jgi:hypothetical protein
MLARTLAYLFPGIDFTRDVVIQAASGIAEWRRPEPQPTAAEIAAAELPATKAFRIAANRAECSRRIFARYPAGRQLSALAGLYDSANVATMVDWIAANISAENTAADLIEAATTVAEVEAVAVVWPA